MEETSGEKGKNRASRSDGGTEEEMEHLLKGLKLTDGERAGVRLGRKGKKKSGAEEKLCLVGRLLTKKHFNVDAMAKTLTMVWRPRGGLDYKMLEGNVILFQFYELEDIRRVQLEGPWSFDGHALILKEFEGDKRQTVRRKYTIKERGATGNGVNTKPELPGLLIGELKGIGKRKLEEWEGNEGEPSLESKRRKEETGRGVQEDGGGSDDDMVLADMVGAAEQPHLS